MNTGDETVTHVTDPPMMASLTAQLKRINEMAAKGAFIPQQPISEVDWSDKRSPREGVWQNRVPARFRDASLADFPQEKADRLREWCAKQPDGNLLIVGPVGTGKTRLSFAVARELFLTVGLDFLFMPVGEMFDLMRPGGDDNAMKQMAKVPVLIIDDLGTEKQTDWTIERLFMVVNRRWMSKLTTICTTNIVESDLEAWLTPRTHSRLRGDGALALRLTGEDRRRGK